MTLFRYGIISVFYCGSKEKSDLLSKALGSWHSHYLQFCLKDNSPSRLSLHQFLANLTIFQTIDALSLTTLLQVSFLCQKTKTSNKLVKFSRDFRHFQVYFSIIPHQTILGRILRHITLFREDRFIIVFFSFSFVRREEKFDVLFNTLG